MAASDPSLLAIFRDLISHDTVSARSNLPLIEYASDLLNRRGWNVRVLPDPSGQKANLLARLGPSGAGGLMLSGHSDVVPVEGQAWSVDPFELTEKEGRYYGRGTADMKGFIALALHVALDVRAADLQVPLWLCLSYDEEVGCLGMQELLRQSREEDLDLPQFALVGEPTDMKVCVLHKGMGQLTVQVDGVEGHSSRPDLGVNAIAAAARLIRRLEEIGDSLQSKTRHDEMLELPFSTMNVGWIRGGGDVVNIIPNRCSFSSDFRLAPGGSADEILTPVREAVLALDTELRSRHPNAGVHLEVNRSYPPFEGRPDHPFARLVRNSVPDPTPIAVGFATEAAALCRAAVETVVCGPGSISQAHRPDEYIEAEAFKNARPWLENVVGRICVENLLSRDA